MRISLLLRSALFCGLFALGSTLVLAQDSFSYGGPPVDIPDDFYDGTTDGMACVDLDNSGGTVDVIDGGISMDMEITHTWVGDLTVKVFSPAGTETTAMATPGQPGAPDDGSTCCGNNDDLDGTPINFADGNPTDAEDLGLAGVGVCTGDGLCDYAPNPDGAPGTDFSDFDGESAIGIWTVCVGDGAAGDVGQILDFTISADILVSIEEDAGETPATHVVSAAYPNPFNPQSQFTVSVAQVQTVTAELYNSLGHRVAVLFDGTIQAGQPHEITIDGAGLASGVYMVRVNGERFAEALSVTLLK